MACAVPPSPAMACIVCFDEIKEPASARACGFCSKRICHDCLPHLSEVDEEGELDRDNGDVRCPNCRGSLLEGELHKRRAAIARIRPAVSTEQINDIVTMEDLIARLMQVCASEEAGVSFYTVSDDIVVQAIAHDPVFSGALERVLKSARRARMLRLNLRRNPTERSNVTALCKEYLALLVQVGLTKEHARTILEEVAQQALTSEANDARYASAWARDEQSSQPLEPSKSPNGARGAKRDRDRGASSGGKVAMAEQGSQSAADPEERRVRGWRGGSSSRSDRRSRTRT